jgi:tRNA threonylcarbamoyladenosine biosynthesis protein TsaE
MRALGSALGRAAREGDVLLLDGPFGAGKTTFVQGLAQGLEIATPIVSPSFVIQTQYREGRLPLYHLDLYRLERLDAALLDEVADLFDAEGVTAVEWPDLLPPDLRAGTSTLHITPSGGDTRLVRLDSPSVHLRDAFAAAAAPGRLADRP